MKASELTGAALDWAVAKCEGLNAGVLTIDAQVGEHENIMRQHYSDAEWEEHLKAWNKHVLPTIKPQLVAFDDEGFPIGFPLNYDGKGHRIAYSSDWAQGGPIIERERIKVAPNLGGSWHGQMRHENKHPLVNKPVLAGWTNKHGPSPLIAAMRCYVASKLGDEVDIPEELTHAD